MSKNRITQVDDGTIQRQSLAAVEGGSVSWSKRELPTGHSPGAEAWLKLKSNMGEGVSIITMAI